MIVVDQLEAILPFVANSKAVIFDLDDTLYDEKDYVRSGFSAVAKELPMIDQVESKLWNAFEKKVPAIDAVLKHEGVWTKELSRQCLEIYRNHKPYISLRDGARDLLQKLRQDGKYLGIITDGRPEGQRNKIKALEVEPLVDSIIITDELGGISFRKPNEKSYEIMKQRCSAEFWQMAYIGDNISKDLIVPEAVGMKGILFKNKNGLYIC